MSNPNSAGRLYRLDLDGRITKVIESVGCSKGMGFSPDLKRFYYTDSFAGEVYSFDYDLETGTLANQRTFASVPKSEGLPDGLTVDRDGYVWSALWEGSALVRFDCSGSIDTKISFPTPKVSSLTFAGDHFREAYVTTAGGIQGVKMVPLRELDSVSR